MAVNPFQVGQRFAQEQQQRQLVIDAGADRQRGVNALAEQFGATALAPAEMAAVTGSVRAAQRLANEETQRKFTNARITEEDLRLKGERDKAAARGATQNLVQFFKKGLENNVPVEQILERVSPALRALGVSDEDIGALPQQLAENPGLLDQLEASLAQQTGPRRVVGNPIPVRLPDGRTGFMKSFSDGSSEFVSDVKPLGSELAAGRLDVSQQRADTAAKRIDPSLRGNIAAQEQAEKSTVLRLTDALPEARNSEVAIQNIDAIIDLADEGIRTGSLAGFRQEASRFFADILGVDAEQVAETDEAFARAGLAVAEQIKSFGAGTGLSDADREFASKIVGGDIGLDIEAIKNLMQMQRKINAKRIKDFNRDRDAFVGSSSRLQKLFPRVGGAATPQDADLEALLDQFAPEGGQ